jgi:hypothetical protein
MISASYFVVDKYQDIADSDGQDVLIFISLQGINMAVRINLVFVGRQDSKTAC